MPWLLISIIYSRTPFINVAMRNMLLVVAFLLLLVLWLLGLGLYQLFEVVNSLLLILQLPLFVWLAMMVLY